MTGCRDISGRSLHHDELGNICLKFQLLDVNANFEGVNLANYKQVYWSELATLVHSEFSLLLLVLHPSPPPSPSSSFSLFIILVCPFPPASPSLPYKRPCWPHLTTYYHLSDPLSNHPLLPAGLWALLMNWKEDGDWSILALGGGALVGVGRLARLAFIRLWDGQANGWRVTVFRHDPLSSL